MDQLTPVSTCVHLNVRLWSSANHRLFSPGIDSPHE